MDSDELVFWEEEAQKIAEAMPPQQQ